MQPRVKYISTETLKKMRERGFERRIDESIFDRVDERFAMVTTYSINGMVGVRVYLNIRGKAGEPTEFPLDMDYELYDSIPDLDKAGVKRKVVTE